jgi:hypothetical protein
VAVAPSNGLMIAGVAAASVALGVAQLVGIPFGARADANAAIGSVRDRSAVGVAAFRSIRSRGPD